MRASEPVPSAAPERRPWKLGAARIRGFLGALLGLGIWFSFQAGGLWDALGGALVVLVVVFEFSIRWLKRQPK